jgi:tetratricopeptide (TPR) repeat protein
MKKIIILALGLFLTTNLVSGQQVDSIFARQLKEILTAGNNAHEQMDYKSSIKYYQIALNLVETLPEESQKNLLAGNIYYDMARCYCLLGKKAQALTALETACNKGFNSPKQMIVDNDLYNLRKNKKFQTLYKELTEKYNCLRILKETVPYSFTKNSCTSPEFSYTQE